MIQNQSMKMNPKVFRILPLKTTHCHSCEKDTHDTHYMCHICKKMCCKDCLTEQMVNNFDVVNTCSICLRNSKIEAITNSTEI